MKKNLPIGISSFESLITGNYIYVDKTSLIYELVKGFNKFFLSRPRRFGKSLLIDTIHCLFEGKKKLFQGLYIYDKWDWSQKFPVIKIDFVGSQFTNSEKVKNRLFENLKEIINYHQIDIEFSNDLDILFHRIIHELAQKYQQKVVILIDEYDKPILDPILNTEVAKNNREILKGFYSVIKANDANLQFVFLTGVSKFSKTSIFSGLNHLNDITLNKQYANLCGYTHEELLYYFKDYLQNVDLEQVQKWYNGYCWDVEKPKVYNPFDILLFLENDKKFKNYWFESGNPSFLMQMLKEKNYYLPYLENLVVDEELLNTFDVENIPIESLLWQTGYLTIKNQIIEENYNYYYELSYPNYEVARTLNSTWWKIYFETNPNQLSLNVIKTLKNGNLEELNLQLQSLFSGISYSYSQHLKNYEGFYGSVVYAFFKGIGLECIAEDYTNIGRIDLTLKIKEKIYIFEFKMVQHNEKPLEQIKRKKYYEKYLNQGKEIYLVGMILDPENKNLMAFEWEKLTP